MLEGMLDLAGESETSVSRLRDIHTAATHLRQVVLQQEVCVKACCFTAHGDGPGVALGCCSDPHAAICNQAATADGRYLHGSKRTTRLGCECSEDLVSRLGLQVSMSDIPM